MFAVENRYSETFVPLVKVLSRVNYRNPRLDASLNTHPALAQPLAQ